jgi:hypothetical protein
MSYLGCRTENKRKKSRVMEKKKVFCLLIVKEEMDKRLADVFLLTYIYIHQFGN